MGIWPSVYVEQDKQGDTDGGFHPLQHARRRVKPVVAAWQAILPSAQDSGICRSPDNKSMTFQPGRLFFADPGDKRWAEA
jgi:hypothetical protein